MRSPSGVSSWMNSPAWSGVSGAGWSSTDAAVVAAPDSTVTCHSFPGPGLGSPGPASRLGVPGLRCLGAVAYAACPVGLHASRFPWDAPHLTIYALTDLEGTWRGSSWK